MRKGKEILILGLVTLLILSSIASVAQSKVSLNIKSEIVDNEIPIDDTVSPEPIDDLEKTTSIVTAAEQTTADTTHSQETEEIQTTTESVASSSDITKNDLVEDSTTLDAENINDKPDVQEEQTTEPAKNTVKQSKSPIDIVIVKLKEIMLGEPSIIFIKNEYQRTLTVAATDPRVLWSDIEINGTCNISELGTYVHPGDKIKNCSELIRVIHKPTNVLLAEFTFPRELYLIINAPSSVTEGEQFQIIVMDQDGNQMANPWVVFYYPDGVQIGYTYNGSILLDAPMVNNYTEGLITADEEGYDGTEVTIWIIDSPPPSTIYVDDDFNQSTPGWNYSHFKHIQDGIDAANGNGTVYVNNGIYHENLQINKPINLIGEENAATIIEGEIDHGHAINIYADNVEIKSFTLRNSIDHYMVNPKGAIFVSNADHFTLQDSMIENNNGSGIILTSSNCCVFKNNTIRNNTGNGIYFYSNSDLNMIQGNVIINNNLAGVKMQYSNFNYFLDNTIGNNEYGIKIVISRYNIIYHNNFINNIQNAYDVSNNSWNINYADGGNYWSDYYGFDNNSGILQNIPGSDEIGDTPYSIMPSSGNIDRYPFMQPNGWLNQPPMTPERPSGGTSRGIVNQTYILTTSTTDSEEDLIYYQWDWGDNTTSNWIGPFGSGLIAGASHAWSKLGTYQVKVKAKDIHGNESDWSESQTVKILVAAFLLD